MVKRWVLLLLLLISPLAAAQTLWGKSAVGMSPGEVIAHYPRTFEPDDPNKGTDGSVEMLRLTDVVIGKNKFRVEFFFKGRSLCSVSLRMDPKQDFPTTAAAFDQIVEAMRVKHGAPLSRNRRAVDPTFVHDEVTWVAAKTTIRIVFLGIIGHKDPPAMWLDYSTRTSDLADQL